MFESLESRLCLAAPSISGFTVTYGAGKDITVSGNVADESPSTVQVTISGVLSGSATPNMQGMFMLSGTASGLGTVSADGLDNEGLQSNTAQAQVTSNNPSVGSLSVSETADGQYVRVSGTVTDESPSGLTVTLSGVVSTSAVTDSMGNFQVLTLATSLGTIFATVTDPWGLVSNTVQAALDSAAPQIVNFGAIEGAGGYWTFQGSVNDEDPEGLTITFGDMLAGHSTTVRADGTFSYTVRLTPDQEGWVSAVTTDKWGLTSNTALAWVEQL